MCHQWKMEGGGFPPPSRPKKKMERTILNWRQDGQRSPKWSSPPPSISKLSAFRKTSLQVTAAALLTRREYCFFIFHRLSVIEALFFRVLPLIVHKRVELASGFQSDSGCP
ncbi:hypothetical protein CEXT_498971 [Caerostris extrusa]|uniref:Uncharacterized protein n=1 Tax=Caerostris extrusa TaxID=172846 RepID=A0AAV4Y225_CAEEX|nr:hypothetical protein CEXT_498971 [Caerostris extrusa]